MAKFTTGNWIELHGQRVEILYWPETDDGFARYAAHRPDGASSLFTEHTSILINHATLIDHGDHEALPNVDPAISNAAEPTTRAKKAPAESAESAE